MENYISITFSFFKTKFTANNFENYVNKHEQLNDFVLVHNPPMVLFRSFLTVLVQIQSIVCM